MNRVITTIDIIKRYPFGAVSFHDQLKCTGGIVQQKNMTKEKMPQVSNHVYELVIVPMFIAPPFLIKFKINRY
ncbi:hypothetical protein BLD47_16230 [Erwinia sp. OLCASP19]|nr:hypothetical protein BLD47_16230 [Erwinia sp. OLCASP19]